MAENKQINSKRKPSFYHLNFVDFLNRPKIGEIRFVMWHLNMTTDRPTDKPTNQPKASVLDGQEVERKPERRCLGNRRSLWPNRHTRRETRKRPMKNRALTLATSTQRLEKRLSTVQSRKWVELFIFFHFLQNFISWRWCSFDGNTNTVNNRWTKVSSSV